MVRSRNSQRRSASIVSCSSSSRRTGSSTPSHRSVEPNTSSTTWPAIPTAWRSPTIAWSASRMTPSPSAGGLRRWQQAEDHDRFSRRVPAAIPHPRSAPRAWFASVTSAFSPTVNGPHRCCVAASRSRPLPPPQQPPPAAQIKCPLCSEPMLLAERITSRQLLSATTRTRFDSSSPAMTEPTLNPVALSRAHKRNASSRLPVPQTAS